MPFSAWQGRRLSVRMGNRLRTGFSATQVREYLYNDSHFQNRNYLTSRWMYQFTPKFRSRILAQYSDDHHGSNVGISALAPMTSPPAAQPTLVTTASGARQLILRIGGFDIRQGFLFALVLKSHFNVMVACDSHCPEPVRGSPIS